MSSVPLWQQQASKLRIGQSKKVPCCGSGPSTYISYTQHGLRIGPCFRCGYKDFVPHKERSAAQIMAARRLPEPSKSASMPTSAVSMYEPSVPSYARLFVLLSGITPEEATDEYGIKYDPERDRVLFPINEGFLSRRVSPWDTSPKWIKYGASETTYHALHRDHELLVTVEDVLSGLVVWRAGFSSIVLLGTAISDGAAVAMDPYRRILCWTDGDKAGDQAFRRLRKRMALFGKIPERIRTASDPKLVHASEIRRIINATPHHS